MAYLRIPFNIIAMKKLSFALIAFMAFGFYSPCTAQPDTTDKETGIIYQFDIREEIAPPVWHRTKKAMKEAKMMNASVILIRMNTYGGMVETADSIRTAILKSPIPVWVFIDNNAASAGALISIACDSIYMREGANIGAATVVNQTGEAMPDKYQSYMRSTMRSTAEATGRDPDIAQGMVDPRVYIPGITDSNQVITFTASEAIKYNYCNAQVNSVADILKITGKENYTIVTQKLTAVDHIIGFLTKPFVSGLLIMLIIGGIYFELQTPGIGFPLGAAVFGALLYFAPLYIEGLAANWEILVFVVGLVLLAIEIFAIPGFGVAGISGILLMLTGLTLSMIDNVGFNFEGVQLNGLAEAFFIVIIATFMSLIGSFYLTRRLFGRSKLFGHLALMTTQPSGEGYISSDSHYMEMIGQTGKTHTILRPAGKIMIDGQLFDAVAQSGYIDKDESVRIIKYENAQLVVRKADPPTE